MVEKKLYFRQSPYSIVIYCDKCGEYLGDCIDEVLYKFGEVVTELHKCRRETTVMVKREELDEMS